MPCLNAQVGPWARSHLGLSLVALADCGDSDAQTLRTAFPRLWATLQRWITTGADVVAPGKVIRVILGGDEKALRVILGITPAWQWLSVFSESYYHRGAVRFADVPRSSAATLRQHHHYRRGVRHAAQHGGAHHVPLLVWPHGEHADHVFPCVLHLWIALGREMARWIHRNTVDAVARAALATATGMGNFSLHPKGSEVRS